MVSIIIPCYNEEAYIARCLDSLLANGFDHKQWEILVLDGMSTDDTRNIVSKYQQKHEFIKLVDNPRKVKPVALNIGIENAKYDIIMRIDAHAIYPTNYVSQLVSDLFQHEAQNSGGLRETDLGNNAWQNVVGTIISHPFAVGNAYWRSSSVKGEILEVDSVFCGCYKREVFQKIGLFNEELIRTQDREFNLRLKAHGMKTILNTSVKCTYFPRTSFKSYWKWNYLGAFWLGYARKFTDIPMLSNRNLVPLLFSIYILLFIPGLLVTNQILSIFLTLPLALYLLLSGFYSITTAIRIKNPISFLYMIFMFFVTHFGYGLGLIHGLLKSNFRFV